MATLTDTQAPTVSPTPEPRTAAAGVGVVGLGLTLVAALAALTAIHIAQGTADLGVAEVWRWMLGGADQATSDVITSSRLPRALAGILVGLALGTAGAVMQSLSRNLLAAPDTLAVNEAAFLAILLSAVVGIPASFFGDFGIAFFGGLAGAALVLGLAGSAYGTVRLILAGVAVTMVLGSVSYSMLILYPQEARGLYAWASGSLAQTGFDGLLRMGPILVVSALGLVLLGRRLDLLSLGDDAATSLGVRVRQTQLLLLLIAVLLSAAAVTLVGPIGYVGLVAPTLVRLLADKVPGLHRHRGLIPIAALTAAVLLIGADVALRALLGAQRAVEIPTGVMTSALGALFLIGLAVRLRAADVGSAATNLDVRGVGYRFAPIFAISLVGLVIAVFAGLLIGDRMLLLGDLAVWARGEAGPIVDGVISTRAPRVIAALFAGMALAVAGCLIQGVTRNPLADPGIIGISGGGALFGVLTVTFVSDVSFWGITLAAAFGALLAATIVFGLNARSGFASDRLVLVGLAVSVGAQALVTLVIVSTDPWNQAKALTWLSGSTYGRSFEHLVPLALGNLILIPLAVMAARRLDLISFDNELPVVLGLSVSRARGGLLLIAVLLTALSVAAIGIVGFAGLVAPHAARTLIGRRHARVIPVAAVLGGTLVVCADTLGRTVIAPIQLPAGLLTAAIGAPYFFWLMAQSRRSAG